MGEDKLEEILKQILIELRETNELLRKNQEILEKIASDCSSIEFMTNDIAYR